MWTRHLTFGGRDDSHLSLFVQGVSQHLFSPENKWHFNCCYSTLPVAVAIPQVFPSLEKCTYCQTQTPYTKLCILLNYLQQSRISNCFTHRASTKDINEIQRYTGLVTKTEKIHLLFQISPDTHWKKNVTKIQTFITQIHKVKTDGSERQGAPTLLWGVGWADDGLQLLQPLVKQLLDSVLSSIYSLLQMNGGKHLQ